MEQSKLSQQLAIAEALSRLYHQLENTVDAEVKEAIRKVIDTLTDQFEELI